MEHGRFNHKHLGRFLESFSIKWLMIVVAIYVGMDYAQAMPQNIDKLIEIYETKGCRVDDANKIFDFLNKEEITDSKIVFAENTPKDSLWQQLWYWVAEWYNDVQDYPTAKKYALKALPLFKYPNMGRSDCLNLLGIIHVRLGEFAPAASYAKQCVDIDMKLGDPDRISSGLNTLAGTYMAANQVKEAEKFILQGLEYADKANNTSRKAILLGMASEVYHKLGKNKKSLDYARDAYELDSINGRKPKMAMRLSQMASALAGLQRYDEAEAAYLRAIAMLKEVGNIHSVGIDLNQLGFVYIEQNRTREAIDCFKEASGIFSKMGDLYNNVCSHKGLYESYWSLSPDSAKIALNQYNALKDSLYHQASAEALARYYAEFGRDMLQDEIRQTNKARMRDIIIGIIIFIVIAAIAAFVIRARYLRHRLRVLRYIKKVGELERKCDEAEKNLADSRPDNSCEEKASEIDDDEGRAFLAQLFEVVDTALDNKDYGVAKIASMMNMTERTFRRRLKEVTDQSPKIFISAIQMERCAKLLLENPTKSIGEIAYLCGFEEASCFSHAFKRVYGCSPTAYREQNK